MSYLLVGHVSQDLLPDGTTRLGGTVTYAGLTAAALGWSVRVVTRAALPLALPEGVTWQVWPSPRSTTFVLRQGEQGRELVLLARAEPLGVADLPPRWEMSQVLHLGPIARECAPDWVEHFAGRAFIGVTLQGWLRGTDEAGRVRYADWDEAERVLPRVQVAVVSREDVEGEVRRLQALARLCPLLVVTDGPRGVTWYAEGCSEPAGYVAVAPQVEVDATGAGDIFAAALFTALVRGHAPDQAIRWAACLAGDSVLRRGLEGVPTPQALAACRQVLSVE